MNLLKSGLKQLGWTQQRFAQHIGVTEKSVSRWANDRIPIPRIVALYLKAAIERDYFKNKVEQMKRVI